MAARKKSSAKPKTRVVYRAPKKKATRRRRTKRGLSAASPAAVKSAAMDFALATGGALLASFLANQKFLDNQSETNKALLIGAAGVITATVFKQPRLAVGMGVVAGLKLVKSTGAGAIVGLSEGTYMLPISEGVPPQMLPYGLQEGADYAGLSEDVYPSDYANRFNGIF